MLTIREKRKIKRILFSKITLILLAVTLVVVLRSVLDVYKKAKYAENNKSYAQREFGKLADRKRFLEEEIGNLSTDYGKESELRDKFDVGREGERLIVLIDTPAVEPKAEEETRKTFFDKLKEITLSIFRDN